MQGRAAYESIELAHLIEMRRYFASELEQLRAMHDMGLAMVGDDAIEVTPLGWYFVRGVAMVFDRHLQAGCTRARFSRII